MENLGVIRKRYFSLLPPMFTHRYTINGEGVYANGINREEVFALFIAKLFEKHGFRHSFIDVHLCGIPYDRKQQG